MDFYRLLPKIELHAHLNGSLSNSTLAELREMKYGKELPSSGIDGCFYKILHGDSLTLEECFKKFQYAHDLTDRSGALERATQRVIEEFANDNVIYLELRTTPKSTAQMSKREYLSTVLEVISKTPVRQPGIIVKLLPSIDRSKGILEAMENVNLAIELNAQFPGTMVAFDLSGNPFGTQFTDFVPALEKARKHGFRLALHCGEFEDVQEVKQMLALGVDRIGHGTFIEGENLAFASQHNIPFECCLTSNVKCKTVPSYDAHHVAKLLKLKQPVCVCTDDFGVFETSLSQEVQICANTFNLSNGQIVELQRNAVGYSFASEEEKQELRIKIDRFAEAMCVRNDENVGQSS